MNFRKSDRILEELLKLHPKIIDLSLDRMVDILAALGNPQNHLPPVIHVAGTNGKGSTSAYLRSILEAANLSVHVYTSPHLVNFNERIRLNGKIIDEQDLSTLLDHCRVINDGKPITYFEITTAAAIKAFADHAADALILEVGLGGRLDATNVVDHPLSTVLTPISLDHEQYLGNDLSIIAMEKASIAKSGVPLVTSQQQDIVQNKIIEIAALKNADLKTDWSFKAQDAGFTYQDQFGTLTLPRPNLIGPHQISNAALAIATLRHQDKFSLDDKCYEIGITTAVWPARMQNISDSPYGNLLCEGSELWLDGGHNPAAAKIITETFKDQKIIIICAMLENKDCNGFLKQFATLCHQLYGIEILGEASLRATKIMEIAQSHNINATTAENVRDALMMIDNSKPHKVLICGSLYLAGHVLRENNLIPQ